MVVCILRINSFIGRNKRDGDKYFKGIFLFLEIYNIYIFLRSLGGRRFFEFI